MNLANPVTGIEILDFALAAASGTNTFTAGTVFDGSGVTTIDQTGATLDLTTSAKMGTSSAPIKITGYAIETDANILDLGANATHGTGAMTGYTIGLNAAEGMYTHDTHTGVEFLAAAAASANSAAGDVMAYVDGGDTFIFAEGENANTSDDVFLQLVGATVARVSVIGTDTGAFHIST